MLLEGKTAVIYGGGGAIGGAVARAFAREGAQVFIAGRTEPPLEKVAIDIREGGGRVELAVFDALDETAVNDHADAVAAQTGSLDISFNLISFCEPLSMPLVDIAPDAVMEPVSVAVRSLMLSARAAARHMMRQRSGAILVFGGYADPWPGYNLGGLQAAFQAQEALRRQLASELGGFGVRVVTLQSGGIAETLPAWVEGRERIVADIDARTMLGRSATLEDVGNVAAFAASDRARSMTATAFNITGGAEVD
jgi:3-oxoacyl-[acyl-carrier protein] reductase